MNNPNVSVIIPVYNTEKYIGKCLDSILKQTLVNIEIICVNDGSSDDSLKELRKYQEKDPRVVVIDQPNKGSAAARNAGLRVAHGMYIGFMDSDDYAENTMYETLLFEAKKSGADVVVCGAHIYPETPRAAQWLYDTLTTPRVMFDHYIPELCFSNVHTNNFLWRTLIRRSVIEENQISFAEDLSLGEDKTFLCTVYHHVEKVSVIPDKLYHYCWHREGSLMDTMAYANNIQKLEAHCRLVDRLADLMGESETSEDSFEFLQWIIPFLYGDFIYQSRNDKIDFANEIGKSLKKINLYYNLIKLQPYMRDDFTYMESYVRKKKEDTPLLSIILYLDQFSKYVDEIIQKLKHFDSKEVEILIMNNGVGGTEYEMLKSWIIEDDHIRLYNTAKHENRPDVLNRGMALAGGEYFLFLDSCDHIKNIDLLLGFCRNDEKFDLCCSGKVKTLNSISAHKNILYRTEWIRENNVVMSDADILFPLVFRCHIDVLKPTWFTMEYDFVTVDPESNLESIKRDNSGGKYLNVLYELICKAKVDNNKEIYKRCYEIFCSDLSKELVKNDFVPNRDYYLDADETSNQMSIIERSFDIVSEFDPDMVVDDANDLKEDIYDFLSYIIHERQMMLNRV